MPPPTRHTLHKALRDIDKQSLAIVCIVVFSLVFAYLSTVIVKVPPPSNSIETWGMGEWEPYIPSPYTALAVMLLIVAIVGIFLLTFSDYHARPTLLIRGLTEH